MATKTLSRVVWAILISLSGALADNTVQQTNSQPEKYIVVVIPSYKNSQWYEKNLAALLAQRYENYIAIYVDDCSPDKTGDLVETYLQKNDPHGHVKLIKNKIRVGAVANIYNAIHGNLGVIVPDDAIIITYDGDDWFAHKNVLDRINTEYQHGNVWLTYGTYVNTDAKGSAGCCRAVPREVIENREFRRYGWVFSHLRTFYAWLFKKIKKEDLMHEGKFLPMTWDLAFMFPMLEMAGSRFSYIENVLYIYNTITPLNDCKTNLKLQESLEEMIRNKPKYPLLRSSEDTIQLTEK